jgi:hypothetical protein
MTKSKETSPEGSVERLSRYGRNFNAAVGAIALGGAAVVASPAIAAGLGLYGAFNLAQAGGFEWARKKSETHRHTKEV